MGGQLTTGSSIYMASAGVPAADGAGLSAIKSFAQLLTSIAALPLAGGTLTGNLLFTDNTYTIGAAGATRPSAVHVGTGGVTSAGVVDAVRCVISGWSFRPSTTATGSAAIYDEVNSRETLKLNPVGNVTLLNNLVINGGTYGAAEAGIIFQQSGAGKWQVYDASSSLRIYNYATAANAMTIAAATSGVTFAAGITVSGLLSVGTYTVATLPAAGSNAGATAQVTDSNVAASGNYGATVAAGGANRVKVFSDGTNWVIA